MTNAYIRMGAGDLDPARQLINASNCHSHPVAVWQTLTGLIDSLGALGQRDELDAMCDLGARLAERLNIDVRETGLGPAQAVALHLAGDLMAAIEMAPQHPAAWELISRMFISATARVAVDLDDGALLDRVGRLLRPTDMANSEHHVHVVAWADAVLTGRLDEAERTLRAALQTVRLAAPRAQLLTELAVTLAARERWDDADVVLGDIATVLATIGEPAPGIRSRADVVRARLESASGHAAAATTQAVRALRAAASARLPLLEIDSLETVAVIHHAAGDDAVAAHILGATTTERARRGYRGRFTTPANQSLVDTLAATHRTAWRAGTEEQIIQVTASITSDEPRREHQAPLFQSTRSEGSSRGSRASDTDDQ